MLPRIPRADPYLHEALEALDQHLELHIDQKGQVDYRTAYASLGASEIQFVSDEIDRCMFDPRYFLENYFAILAADGTFRTLYPFWGSQEIFFDWFAAKRARGGQTKAIVLKGRQEGLSTLIQALVFWLTIFNEGYNSLLVGHDPQASGAILYMSRRAWEMLPWWMRPEKRYEAKDKYIVFDREDPVERLRRPGLRSQIIVQAANKVTGVGVGQTFRAAHFTELCRFPNGKLLTDDILPTLHAPDLFGVMESTALGEGDFWNRLWLDASEGLLDWEPIFIPFYRRPEYSLPIAAGESFKRTEEEEAIVLKVREETPDHFELKDEILNWRRAKVAEYVAIREDEWMFRQDYPITAEEAFQASGTCAFDKAKLQSMIDIYSAKPRWVGEISLKMGPDNMPTTTPIFPGKLRAIRPDEKVPPQKHKGARLHIWEGPETGAKYYIGADVAYGIEGLDFSCAQVIKVNRAPKPDVQVAEWHGWIKASQYAQVLAALGYFYNSAEIACEANDVGKTVNNELVRGLNYPNWYRWKHVDKLKNFQTDYIGWETNVKTRPQMINRLNEAVDGGSRVLVIRSVQLLKQMMSFGQGEDGGRIEGQGGHDDRVMSFGICFYCAHELEFGRSRGEDGEINPADPLYQKCLLDAARMLSEVLRFQITARGYGVDHALGRGEKIPDDLLQREAERLYHQRKVVGDFADTAWSPVFDKPGLRQDMHLREGLPPEMIYGSDVHEVEDVDEDDQWRTKW